MSEKDALFFRLMKHMRPEWKRRMMIAIAKESMTVNEIAQLTGKSESAIRRTLTNMQADGLIQYEKYAKPRRYTLDKWATVQHKQGKITITYRSWKRHADMVSVTIPGS